MSTAKRRGKRQPNPFDIIETIAQAPVLLVASDYDGTLAPIVDDPMRAFPRRETMVALKNLATMPNTPVALISGRSLKDLATLTGSPTSVHLVGSHGSEFDPDFAEKLSFAEIQLLQSLVESVQQIATRDDGAFVETKPASVAFHYRNVSNEKVAEDLLQRVVDGPASEAGVHVRRGKKVIELSVVATDKGAALEAIRTRVGASVAIFIGDDETDEDAFMRLRGPDISIKVGDGESRAHYRLRSPDTVSRFLVALAEKRAAWLCGGDAVPIEQHSLLSDHRTLALVDSGARINWLCLPRLDSESIFAELLGGPTAGFFGITDGGGEGPQSQNYLGDSMILESHWPAFKVTDYLDCSGGRARQRPGRSDLIRVIEGHGKVNLEFAPRLDFGRANTRLRPEPNGLVVADSACPLVLYSPGVSWELRTEGIHQTAVAQVTLGDEPLVLELRCGLLSLGQPVLPERRRREQTHKHWSDWVRFLRLPKTEHTNLVKRSALVLKALCYGPSGGIAAAATTSLPEHIGGVRNWDYRYCWLRDAAMSAEALARLGSLNEGMHFLDWVLSTVDRASSPERLRPLYSVSGEELGVEAEIAELGGYAGSRPVRVGNAASRQLQLDVFGPVLQLMWVLLQEGAPLSTEHWQLVEDIVSAVARRWHEPDHGIWEVRGPRRHFLHSKVMCWLAVDRGIHLAEGLVGEKRPDWEVLRDTIRDDVLSRGWKEQVHSFVAAYDGTDLDASVLYTGLTGMVDPSDRRFVQTVEAIERFLREGPTVFRYRFEDGLPGEEGGFNICTSWLIDAYLLVGREGEAKQLLQQLIDTCSGPTGLYSEEYDPKEKRCLGNFPQAYTHLGLIFNVLHMASAGESAVGSEEEPS